MAVRRAETIYLGDASSVIRATQTARKANADYAASAEAAGRRVAASNSKTSSSLAATGKSLSRLTAPILAGAAASIKFSVDFQSAMEQVHTQAGASQAEVNKMSAAVLKLAPSTEQGPVQLAKALYELESVGMRGARALTALKVASNLAAVGGASLQTATSALASAMVAWQIPTSKATQTAAQLNAIVGAGKMHMQDLVDAMGTKLPGVSHMLGISLSSVGAALAVFTDQGVTAETAATNLVTPLYKMAVVTAPAAKKALASIGLGVHTLADDLRTGGIAKAIEDLHQHLRGLSKDSQTDIIAKAFGGSRGSAPILQLLGTYNSATNSIMARQTLIGQNTKKYTDDVAKEHATAAHQIKTAWSAIQTALITVGQSLAPVVTQVAGFARKVAGFFTGLSPSARKMIVDVALVVAAIGPLIGVAGKLGTAIKLVTSPLGLVVTGLIALQAAGVPILGTFKDVVNSLGGVQAVLPAVVAGFVSFKVISAIGPMLKEVAAGMELVKTAGLAATLAGMTTPIGLAAVAIGGLVLAFSSLGGHEDSEAAAARGVADAKRAEADAINAAKDASLAAADAGFAATHAASDLKDATNAAAAARKKYGADSPQYRATQEAEREAVLRNREAQQQVTDAMARSVQSQKDSIAAAKKGEAQDSRALDAAIAHGASLKRLAQINADWTAQIKKAAQASAQLALVEIQRQRLEAGGDLITNRNAQAIANLVSVFKSLPKSVQTKLLVEPQNALAAIGNVVGLLKGVASRKTIAKLLGDSAPAQVKIADLISRLKGVVNLRTIAKILGDSSNAQQAINALTALLGTLPAKGHDAGVGIGQGIAQGIRDQGQAIISAGQQDIAGLNAYLSTVTTAGPKLGAPHKAGDVGVRAAAASPLFPHDAALTSLNAQSAADQAKFAALDLVAQSRALHGALLGARNESRSNPSRGHDIQAAIDAIKAFNLQASRAKTLAAIDLKIKGIQQLKDYSDAIAGIRTNLTGLAQTAAQTWRTAAEAAINATHDQAIAAATAARAAAQSATDNSPDAQMLAALQATDASAADAAQTKQLNDALAAANQGVTSAQTLVAHSGGQAHVDAVAALAAAVQAAKDAQDAIDAYNRQKQETVLQANIAASNANADAVQAAAVSAADASQAAALAGLDKEQADFENALNLKLQAETTALATRKENYAKWAQDINAILSQYGLTAPVDPSTEGTVTAGPGTTPPKPTTGKHPKPKGGKHPKPKSHKAMGGPVDAYTPYYVGERGMETFVPDRPGVILTATQTRNGGGGGNVIIQGNLNVNSARHAKAMAQQLAFRAHVGAQ